MKGFIYLHRRLMESSFYRKSAYVHLWIHLLLSANHKEQTVLWNGKEVTLKPGQFITGRTELVKKTGIPGTTIERTLKVFENEHQIGQQKTNKFRLISILKWEEYQSDGHQDGQEKRKKRTSSGHHKDTDNNVINNTIASSVQDAIDYFCEAVGKTRGFVPRITAKDAALVKKELRTRPLDNVKKQIDFFLANSKAREHLTLAAALSADTYNLFMAGQAILTEDPIERARRRMRAQ